MQVDTRTLTSMQPKVLLLPTLAFIVMTLSVLQTMVIPIIGIIGAQLRVGPTASGWVLTANLLAAVVATPIMSRLADLYGKRPVLLAVLIVVVAGSVICSVATSLAPLLIGRALQGASYALFPISLAVARDELNPARLVRAMALLSGTLGVGSGAGLVLTGILTADGADYHLIFWLTVAFSALSLVLVFFGVPSRARTSQGNVDWLGAFVLGVALILLFLALTQGRTWGWGSTETVGLAGAGVLALSLWWIIENRSSTPLVAPRMFTHTPLAAAHIATGFVGIGMFVNFLACSSYVQTSSEAAGYGFSADVRSASLVYLLPGAALGAVAAVLSGGIVFRIGPKLVLLSSGVIGVGGFISMALFKESPWQLIVASSTVNVFVSLSYAAIPNILAAEVSLQDTSVANSVNSIVRTIGTSLASAVLTTTLAAYTIAGTAVPLESVYTVAFVVGGVGCAIVSLCALMMPSRTRAVSTNTSMSQSTGTMAA